MEVSQEVYEAGQHVTSTSEVTPADALNEFLGRFLEWPFKAASGFAMDRDGNETKTFASVIYTSSEGPATTETRAIPADTVAAVVDVCESLDLENFRAAYGHIAQAKRLKKSPAPRLERTPTTTITLGVIFALRSELPLETFAEELDRLNTQTPGKEWPDMVVIASTGVINYAVQFPGEGLSGDTLPPAEGALAAYTPPVYVVMVMRPTGDYTLNKMMAFLFAHLAIFSPGAKLPNFAQILQGVPQHALTVTGYQYNLSGDLLPVPRQFYNDRYLPPLPMRIEDQKGDLLCTLQFLPWQDGGVILLKGKLPLDGLLIFLGEEALKRGRIVRRANLQISYVLPITQTHFIEMLRRIERQSNMVVRRDQTKFVVQKLSDEGTQSPFVARLYLGLLHLRDLVYPGHTQREKFDKFYEIVISSLQNARETAQGMVRRWEEHCQKVISGEVARPQGQTIHVDESVDKELRKGVEDFLNAAVRALKQGMQNLAAELQLNIGFLFRKQAAFETGLAVLEKTDPLLAEYLQQTRVWSERLVERRNAIEHEGWMLPRVTYSHTGAAIRANEPPVSGQPVSEFVSFMLDRLTCFVEELTAHCLQRQMPTGTTITEIALAHRAAEAPERFRVTLASGGMSAWKISYHHSTFEET